MMFVLQWLIAFAISYFVTRQIMRDYTEGRTIIRL